MTSPWYAPPAGSRSGIADYAARLGRAVRALGEWRTPVYHLGNNRLHEQIYARSLREPGVVVLHDAVLHHFLLGALQRERYVEEFVYNYGEWRRHLAEELWEERGGSGVDPRYFAFPLLQRAVENARAVIAHNPGAAAIARAHGAREVHVVPHFFDPVGAQADGADVAAFRERIGTGQGTFLFGIFGYLRETKRVLPSLRAFRRLHALRPRTALLLAGEPVSSDLARLLESEAGQPGVIRLGHLSERDFVVAAASVDACVNLRYPAAGETSGVAVRLMGAGKPVIMTEGEENSDIPAGACLRVRAGVAEAAELFDYMVLLTEFPGVAREVGGEVARHIRERHSLGAVARQYHKILCAASF